MRYRRKRLTTHNRDVQRCLAFFELPEWHRIPARATRTAEPQQRLLSATNDRVSQAFGGGPSK
jgi:hypothetical protein